MPRFQNNNNMKEWGPPNHLVATLNDGTGAGFLVRHYSPCVVVGRVQIRMDDGFLIEPYKSKLKALLDIHTTKEDQRLIAKAMSGFVKYKKEYDND